jgi:DNA-directed RNA polymerase subunit RPC12/RpoP
MIKLITVYSSNIPIDCHILKGRLETDGIPCFIYDENLIWIHPFKAVAIGGVKLKVPSNMYEQSQKIIDLTAQGKLIDGTGEYQISEILNNEINRQNEILSIKSKIRNNSSLLEKSVFNESKFIDTIEIEKILEIEREFQELTKKKFRFSWKQFFYELFDFDRSIFKYFRTKSVDYYIEKEIVENYTNQKESRQIINCPNCNSENTAFGYAIDSKLDILYLLLSLLMSAPLFPIRKKYHCFDCGNDFKKQNGNS